MGVLDRFLDAIKLNDDYDDEYMDDEFPDDDEDDFFDDDEEEVKPKKKFFEKFSKKNIDDDFDTFDDEPSEKPKTTSKTSAKATAKTSSAAAAKTSSTATEKPSRPVQISSKITPMRGRRTNSGQASKIEVCVIKPTSMEDTREIADTLLDNSTVILNLEGIDVELAQRIIDFASGACYSLDGTLQKIASYIFVLGPSSVDITGDLQNILGGAAPSVRAGY